MGKILGDKIRNGEIFGRKNEKLGDIWEKNMIVWEGSQTDDRPCYRQTSLQVILTFFMSTLNPSVMEFISFIYMYSGYTSLIDILVHSI